MEILELKRTVENLEIKLEREVVETLSLKN